MLSVCLKYNFANDLDTRYYNTTLIIIVTVTAGCDGAKLSGQRIT